MKTTMKLEWRKHVRFARAGGTEKQDRYGKPTLMLWADVKKTVFVTDPLLLEQISMARRHSNPFALIGPQHTGKNVFLNLVARGEKATSAAPCVDENVAGAPDTELERFFGRGGVVDRNRSALIQFDFMERAVKWGSFIEKLNKIAVERVLDRTDGKIIPCPRVRVVLGANYDLRPILPSGPGLVKYLYTALANNQKAETRRLEDQPERIPAILEEMLAALVIRGEIDDHQAAKVECVPTASVNRLRQYSVPDEFTGLFGIVRAAARYTDWERAINETRPGTVFLAWGGKSRLGGARLADWLRDTGVIVEKAPESVSVGDWWSQIKEKLSKADFIVFTFCRADFSASSRLVKFAEWREAVEKEKSLARPLIFPVFLDRTRPDQLDKASGVDRRLVNDLLARHWYWVSLRTRAGFEKLHADLTKWFRIIRNN